MRKILIAFEITFSSTIYAVILMNTFFLLIKNVYFVFKYGEIINDDELAWLTIITLFYSYIFGVYNFAVIFMLFSKRDRDIIPSVLVGGSVTSLLLTIIISFILSYSLTVDSNFRFYTIIGLFFILQMIGIGISCKFKSNKSNFRTTQRKKIAIALLINLILLLLYPILLFLK